MKQRKRTPVNKPVLAYSAKASTPAGEITTHVEAETLASGKTVLHVTEEHAFSLSLNPPTFSFRGRGSGKTFKND